MRHVSKISVLIVDGSPVIVKRLITKLQEYIPEKKIKFSFTGIDALELINDNNPRSVILDIHLPDTNGTELLRKIKEFYPHTKVVVLTNETDAFFERRCQLLGSDGFYDKSIEVDMAIDKALEFAL